MTGNLTCPRCNADTILEQSGSVEFHSCRRCGGLFLHRGELNKIAEPTPGDLEFSSIDMDSFEHEDRYGPIDCPHCGNRPMNKVEFNIHTGIILDWCEACGGFWLDRPELDRINEEVRHLNEAAKDTPDPPMLWFARFIWSLPR